MTRTEKKGDRKRTTTTKQNNSNSSYLVEEITVNMNHDKFVVLHFIR